MNSEQLDYWRRALSGQELREAIRIVEDLAPLPIPARAMKLREKLPSLEPALLKVALETAAGREILSDSTPWSRDGFFLQSRLEQSTRPAIARHHAQRFSGRTVLEVGCGIGFDTAALGQSASEVFTIDTDPLCCAITEHNLSLQNISTVTVLNCSFEELNTRKDPPSFDALWADPGRRTEQGERIYDPEDYRPALSSITGLDFDGLMGIKISPAANVTLPAGQWSREFIGWEWSCPEQVLWKNSSIASRTATLADAGLEWHQQGTRSARVDPDLLTEGAFLLEPHPALVRTGDLEFFYDEFSVSRLDLHLSLGLLATPAPQSAWYRTFEVLENIRFTPKGLKERLHQLGWDSRTQIKKRGVKDDPDQVHRALKLPAPHGDSPWGFVILTKIDNSPRAILARRV